MSSKQNKTALVTGANAGLGFEAAAQLAADGWGQVILACRSVEKAEAARAQLVERTGKDPFSTLAIDTAEVAAAQRAAEELRGRGVKVDFLLLNAGASKTEATFTTDGLEITYASTLVGHHVLVLRALEYGLLAPTARIVHAGSEGARGNLPGMAVHDIEALAERHREGDWAGTIAAMLRLELPEQKSFKNMNEYVTAKLLVAWWTAALARRLPTGMTVNTVSPGANAATSFARDASVGVRLVMLPMMKLVGGLMGMNGPIEDGARRYLDAYERDGSDSGNFYATAHRKKLVGPVAAQTWPAYFQDQRGHEATLAALEAVTGVRLSPGRAAKGEDESAQEPTAPTTPRATA